MVITAFFIGALLFYAADAVYHNRTKDPVDMTADERLIYITLKRS